MTKLLCRISKSEDAVAVIRNSKIDILDIAIGRRKLLLSFLPEIVKILDGKIRLSLSMPLACFDFCRNRISLGSIDMLQLKEETGGFDKKDWKRLKQFSNEYKMILRMNADEMNLDRWYSSLEQAKLSGFSGVMLETDSRNLFSPLRKVKIINDFFYEVKQLGLFTGLVAQLEAPDVPRLLLWDLDILGVSFVESAFLKKKAMEDLQLLRSLIPFERGNQAVQVLSNVRRDRILVSDLIIPMYIGAYSSERTKKQRVSFNVIVDVAPVCIHPHPKDMRHVFSYDLILDEIRRLASLGHMNLVETLAERLAAFILSYPQAQRVLVRVEKLDLGPRAVGVEIMREKSPSQ
ncbi:MAG: dihydroneopterin aldolase [Candidatus Tokpelaia sp. JSC161]|jgi:dihydroneopterin aldolase|nr:MAG: dihydroneopterin aldolase [Candidatus Tokpelaia sp. JSC161]